MLNVYLGGTLMVLGLIALIGMPTAGVVMIGAGYWLFQQSTAAQRHVERKACSLALRSCAWSSLAWPHCSASLKSPLPPC